jgi:formylglycine-generating enzyme required for sulfatase activity
VLPLPVSWRGPYVFLVSLAVAGCTADATPSGHETFSGCPARMALSGEACVDRFEAVIAGGLAEPATDRPPSSSVSWHEADAACRASGHRLCTSDEWTRACAGEEGRAFPYGAAYEPGRCHTAEQDMDLSLRAPIPSGRLAGCVTPEGVHDLSGNVWEWVDRADAGGTLREIRGGGFNNGEEGKRVRCRFTDPIFQPADTALVGLGFRCCREAT